MLKKLLILPILGSILGLGAFASADTVSDIASCFSYDEMYGYNNCMGDGGYTYYPNNNTNSCIVNLGYTSSSVDTFVSYVTSQSSSCSVPATSIPAITYNLSLLVSDTPDVPDDSDSSLGIPEIPASFTSGLTSLVNNFGGTIANWLPSIILVALGIYAIFALFRVVRNYARSTFRG